MEKTDLRIGNIVTIDGRENHYTVMWVKPTHIQIMKVGTDYPSAIVEIERVQGVPLTAKLCEKIGLKKIKENTWLEDKIWYKIKIRNCTTLEICFKKKMAIIFYEQKYNMTTSTIIKFPKYVHQLQNLYFALTGEELKYELSSDK